MGANRNLEFVAECPVCMDEVRRTFRPDMGSEYWRCIQCSEVFIRVGNALVSALPKEFDLEGAAYDRFTARVKR